MGLTLLYRVQWLWQCRCPGGKCSCAAGVDSAKNMMFLCLCGWIVQDSVLVLVCVCVCVLACQCELPCVFQWVCLCMSVSEERATLRSAAPRALRASLWRRQLQVSGNLSWGEGVALEARQNRGTPHHLIPPSLWGFLYSLFTLLFCIEGSGGSHSRHGVTGGVTFWWRFMCATRQPWDFKISEETVCS